LRLIAHSCSAESQFSDGEAPLIEESSFANSPLNSKERKKHDSKDKRWEEVVTIAEVFTIV
jgi:hypothetical protein